MVRFLALAAILAAAAPAAAQETRYLAVFHDAIDESVIADAGGTVVRRVDTSRLVAAYLAPDQVQEVALHPAVAGVFEDGPVGIPDSDIEADARGGKGGGRKKPAGGSTQALPWGVDRINAEQVWSASTGAGVRVAVVDSGIDDAHRDFMDAAGNSRVVLGPDFVNGLSSRDDNGHGTHVAGTIGASHDSAGVVGVAPGCTLVAVKVLDAFGSGFWSDLIAAIDWCAANDIQIVNMSLGGLAEVPPTLDALARAHLQGVLHVAAAGNSGDDFLATPFASPPSFPAVWDVCIAVAATDAFDSVAGFSTKGPQVDLAAPGVSILSTWPGGGYATLSGTSMACPHVAGTAALILGTGVARTNDEVRALLELTADDLGLPGPDPESGFGLVDALQAVLGSPLP